MRQVLRLESAPFLPIHSAINLSMLKKCLNLKCKNYYVNPTSFVKMMLLTHSYPRAEYKSIVFVKS